MKPLHIRSVSILIASVLLLTVARNTSAASHKERPNQHKESPSEQPQAAQQRQPEPTVPLSVHRATESALLEALRTIRAQEEAAAKRKPQYQPVYAPSNLISLGLLLVGAVYSFFAWKQWAAINKQAQIARVALTANRLALNSARKSADAAKQQTEIADASLKATQKTLVLTHRPKVIVRNVVIKPNVELTRPFVSSVLFPRGFSVQGQLYAVNVGDTPAYTKECGCWVIWKALDASGPLMALPMYRPYDGKNGNVQIGGTLQPGQSIPLSFMSDEPMGTEADQGWPLYVMGWIEYRDELGTPRRTAFCRLYDTTKGRFVAVNDPDYEHAE